MANWLPPGGALHMLDMSSKLSQNVWLVGEECVEVGPVLNVQLEVLLVLTANPGCILM